MRADHGVRPTLAATLVVLPTLALAAAGDPDPGFGNGGTVVSTTEVGAVGALALQPDGHVVVAATASTATGADVVLLRLDAAGTPDATFGNGGEVRIATTAFAPPALVVEPDGSLVLGFTRCIPAPCVAAIQRYDPHGVLDTSFSPDVVSFPNGPDTFTRVDVLARQDDGTIVAAGKDGVPPGISVWLARWGTDGKLDGTFGTAGAVRREASFHGAAMTSLLVEPGGTLLASETEAVPDGGVDHVLRFTMGGSLVAGPVTPFETQVIARAPDGRVVLAGSTGPFSALQIGVARLAADLTPDASFDGGNAVAGPAGQATDVLVDPAGSIVVAATLDPADAPRFALLRWTADAMSDAAFGDAGRDVIFAGQRAFAGRVVRQTDGKLVAAGFLDAGGGDVPQGPLVVARLVADEATSSSTTTTTTAPGPGVTTTTAHFAIPTTTTTIPVTAARCDGPAACDDGDPCTLDACSGGICTHTAAGGFDAVTCLCATPIVTCGDRAAAGTRAARACRLVTRGRDVGDGRARALVRRAVRLLRHAVRSSGDSACDDERRGRVDELRRRATSLLEELGAHAAGAIDRRGSVTNRAALP